MNRTVKFRGKSKKTGVWLFGDLVRNAEGAFAVVPPFEITTDNHCERYEVDGNTIGQFTGLLDKNGKEIYECDIVSFDDTPYNVYGNKYVGNVVSVNGAWSVKHSVSWCTECFYAPLFADVFADRKTVVLGNVYDNIGFLKNNWQ